MTEDITAMRRAVSDLQLWLKRRELGPTMEVAVLTAALSEVATAHSFNLLTVAEQLLLCAADYHGRWAQGLEQEAPHAG